MLTHLIVRDFAIIRASEIAFQAGMTALTGETGAGKSILISALNLVLGGRASAELVRADAKRAVVEAIFEVEDQRPTLEEHLDEMGIELGSQLIIRRIVTRAGRSKAFVNGSAVTLATLRELTSNLVDISGQHEHYSLMDANKHVGLLDSFGGLGEEAARLAEGVDRLKKLEREVNALQTGERERLQRVDYLRFQIQELEDADLKPGEEEQLEGELDVLRHGERILHAANDAFYAIYDGENAALDVVGDACDQLHRVSGHDKRLADLTAYLESARGQLRDAALELRDYCSEFDLDPGRLQTLEERAETFFRLRRKHGGSVDELVERLVEMKNELAKLENAEERIDEALAEKTTLTRSLMAEARTLSARRAECATRLAEVVEGELSQLQMASCRFSVEQTFVDGNGQVTTELDTAAPAALSRTGIDRIEFLISPNPGEDPKPIGRIASGGELSRIMLAIKNALMQTDPVETYVFDEVDTGIGGQTGDVLGRKIKEVSRRRQVLCITHLPQIAAYADHHMVVRKSVEDGRTESSISELSRKECTEEVARMLGGSAITRKTLAHARELIAKAR